MTAHTCPECQLLHDGPTEPGEPVELQLARIESDRAIQIARIQAGADRAAAAAAVEVAHEEARADVQAAQAEAEILGEAIEASGMPEPVDPVEVIAPEPEPEPEPDDAPPVADGSPVPGQRERRRGIGMW